MRSGLLALPMHLATAETRGVRSNVERESHESGSPFTRDAFQKTAIKEIKGSRLVCLLSASEKLCLQLRNPPEGIFRAGWFVDFVVKPADVSEGRKEEETAYEKWER